MLYTEEGLYLEWKVVSFIAPKLTKQTCLDGTAAHSAWVQIHTPRRTCCFVIFYFCTQVPSL